MKFAGQDSDSEEEDDEGEFDSDEEFPDYLIDEMDPEAMAQYRAAQQSSKRCVLVMFGLCVGIGVAMFIKSHPH